MNLSGLLVLAVFIVCFATSCTALQHNEKFLNRLMDSKETSLDHWDQDQMLRTVAMRTGMLVRGEASITMAGSTLKPDGTFSLSYTVSGSPGAAIAIGSAVPISEDGYFLTARHNVKASNQTLFSLAHDRGTVRMLETQPRVVWKASKEDDLDLALLHARIRPFQPFALSDIDALRRQEFVAATGWSGVINMKKNALAGMAAGQILSLSDSHGSLPGVTWRKVRHTCPLNPGDSGGPLVDRTGRLIGVNGVVHVTLANRLRAFVRLDRAEVRPISGYSADAVIPEAQWLHSKIEEDRASM